MLISSQDEQIKTKEIKEKMTEEMKKVAAAHCRQVRGFGQNQIQNGQFSAQNNGEIVCVQLAKFFL